MKIEYQDYQALKMQLVTHQAEILTVLKAFISEKRFEILIQLLDGPKSFQALLDSVHLQKTALAHHLSSLQEVFLIEKPGYGSYKIHQDGAKYLETIYNTWLQSLSVQKLRMARQEQRGLSPHFINAFFQKE